jgi:ABC-type nitrate/sulfonate/bicarbonate transport system ATPase subunit
MEPVLSLSGITKTFSEDGNVCPALAGISLEIFSREIVCILGPSGCGKTTLLRIIGGLEHADTGTIQENSGPSGDRPQTAVVFQDHALFPWLSVLENIAYGLRLSAQKVPDGEIARRAEELLRLTHLDPFANSYPHQLSGGMKQRAAVARALAVHPRILLMDEPFSALDPFTRRELEDEILRIRTTAMGSGKDVTILLITHNPEEAVYLADRIIVLSDRPAVVQGTIRVDLPHPRNVADPLFLAIREQVAALVKH